MATMMGRREMFRAGAAATALAALGIGAASPAQPVPARRRIIPLRGSRLDAGEIELLFADLQVPLVAGSATMPPAKLSQAAAVLAKVATILKMPTLFSVVPEGDGPPHLIPELRAYATDANTILRTPVSPFHHAPTVAALARNGRRTLVIAGFAAEAVVVQAALDAIAACYTVFYVVDAIGGLSERTEGAAFRDIENAGAMPTSVLSFATRLAPDFISSPGRETFAALQPLLPH